MNNRQVLTVQYVFLLSLWCHLLTLDTGNVQSYLPDLLQSLPPQQIASRGGRTSWNYPLSQTSYRDEFAVEAVCFAYSVRSGERREELSDIFVAARWPYDVFEATRRSLLPS